MPHTCREATQAGKHGDEGTVQAPGEQTASRCAKCTDAMDPMRNMRKRKGGHTWPCETCSRFRKQNAHIARTSSAVSRCIQFILRLTPPRHGCTMLILGNGQIAGSHFNQKNSNISSDSPSRAFMTKTPMTEPTTMSTAGSPAAPCAAPRWPRRRWPRPTRPSRPSG